MYTPRKLNEVVSRAARVFPALVVTGPRRSGKTTLFRHAFPDAQYVLLEDPDVQARVRSDARSFLEGITPPVILDEIQNVPQLLDYVRTRIDEHPTRMGQWLFTGSQEAPMMQGITESMAGRAAILQLLPFSITETPRVTLLHGGFPEVLAHPSERALWFSSYLQTYLERDVRAITNIRDLVTFRRFLSLVASRHGQILNRTDIAAPLGVTVRTVGLWLEILEITNQILIVPPYFENFGKRLIKTPRVYWADSGMACYLLGIQTEAELERSPFLGALYEGFVAAEIVKSQINRGERKELYFFRDQQGLEIDFLVPRPNARLWLVEAKASRTVVPAMANSMLSLSKALGDRAERSVLVHRKSDSSLATRAIAPGVEALDLTDLLAEFSARS